MVATHLSGLGPGWEEWMLLIATFIGLAIVGQVANILIAIGLEQISETVSLAMFFVMFAGVFYLAWQLALRFIERRTDPGGVRGR